MKPKVVKHNNDAQNISMQNWKSSEQNILITIFALMRDKGTVEQTIDLNKLKEYAEISETSHSEWKKMINNVSRKITSLNYFEESPEEAFSMSLFSTFRVDHKNKKVTIKTSENWEYMLNRLGRNFTSYDLSTFLNLRSAYSRTIFRNLAQFKTTGKWFVTEENFRFKLGIPKSYQSSNIQARILDPALEELTSIYPNLQVKKRKDAFNKNKILGYEFTWDPKVREKFNPNKYKNLDNGDPNNYSNSILKEYDFSPNHSRKYTKVGEMNYLKLDNFKDTKASRNRYDLSHWVDENGEVVVFEAWMGSLLRERRYDDDHVEKVYPKNMKINIPEDILKELKEYAPEEVHIISNDPEGEALIKELIEEGFFDD